MVAAEGVCRRPARLQRHPIKLIPPGVCPPHRGYRWLAWCAAASRSGWCGAGVFSRLPARQAPRARRTCRLLPFHSNRLEPIRAGRYGPPPGGMGAPWPCCRVRPLGAAASDAFGNQQGHRQRQGSFGAPHAGGAIATGRSAAVIPQFQSQRLSWSAPITRTRRMRDAAQVMAGRDQGKQEATGRPPSRSKANRLVFPQGPPGCRGRPKRSSGLERWPAGSDRDPEAASPQWVQSRPAPHRWPGPVSGLPGPSGPAGAAIAGNGLRIRRSLVSTRMAELVIAQAEAGPGPNCTPPAPSQRSIDRATPARPQLGSSQPQGGTNGPGLWAPASGPVRRPLLTARFRQSKACTELVEIVMTRVGLAARWARRRALTNREGLAAAVETRSTRAVDNPAAGRRHVRHGRKPFLDAHSKVAAQKADPTLPRRPRGSSPAASRAERPPTDSRKLEQHVARYSRHKRPHRTGRRATFRGLQQFAGKAEADSRPPAGGWP